MLHAGVCIHSSNLAARTSRWQTVNKSGMCQLQALVGQRFAELLLSATPRSRNGVDAELVAHLAMAASHPVAAAARFKRSHWAAVMRVLPAIPDIVAGARLPVLLPAPGAASDSTSLVVILPAWHTCQLWYAAVLPDQLWQETLEGLEMLVQQHVRMSPYMLNLF